MTGKTYSDSTPPVSYNYDETAFGPYPLANMIGRLTSAWVGTGSSVYSKYGYDYDAMGRVYQRYFSLPNATGTSISPGIGAAGDSYDLAGNVTYRNTGNGIGFTITRDGTGRAISADANDWTTEPLDGVASTHIFLNATYTPLGALSTRQLGNGLTEMKTYDRRGRLTSTAQAQTGSSVSYTVSTGYDPASNVAVNDSVNGSWAYGYDSLNRLHQAASSTGLNLDWEYDSFGNRKSQTPSGTGTAPQVNFTFNGNNNQADPSSGMVYDAAGNVIVDNLGQAYTYDAEERITAATPFGGGRVTYQYDSEGNLVYENGPSGTQIFHRNGDGQPDYIQPASGAPGPYWDTYVYIDGEQIGSWQDSTFFGVGADTVGTKRFESWGTGDVASGAVPLMWNPTFTSLPFGDALSSVDIDPSHFTGKERDAESGLDYFGARYYSSTMGRFSSPDPSGLAYASLANPQSLNLYSYALNNPLRLVDPSGLTSCFYGGAGDTPENDTDASDYEDTGTDQNCLDNGGKVLSENATVNVNADDSGSITITADGGGSSTLIQQINICRGQGNGPSLTNFQAAGAAVADSLTSKDLLQNVVGMKQNLSNLYNLRSGGTLDAQAPNGGPGPNTTPYANYGYGMYMGSAGYSLRQTLNGANAYAGTPRAIYGNGQLLPGKYGNQPPDFFDPTYKNTPAANVPNIVAGYQAALAGNTSCPTF
jgi:RHS repeat-associated protein